MQLRHFQRQCTLLPPVLSSTELDLGLSRLPGRSTLLSAAHDLRVSLADDKNMFRQVSGGSIVPAGGLVLETDLRLGGDLDHRTTCLGGSGRDVESSNPLSLSLIKTEYMPGSLEVFGLILQICESHDIYRHKGMFVLWITRMSCNAVIVEWQSAVIIDTYVRLFRIGYVAHSTVNWPSITFASVRYQFLDTLLMAKPDYTCSLLGVQPARA
ncbi:hypothetical protein BKA67DRAFT_649705 [Truncatella angustata]|uniref:Uncharacterized protein n=1 Tax=Truncatella angustata TaxID=152316 RepID=A0A9P8UDS1_9PEZI|nr:uncharacterized protein BKA67DRAFT_649705 [Truncatella angustata]KAH6648059.1 hypothetical protein BKA67DRAFT_649705 [Truncatella angustata]